MSHTFMIVHLLAVIKYVFHPKKENEKKIFSIKGDISQWNWYIDVSCKLCATSIAFSMHQRKNIRIRLNMYCDALVEQQI